MTQAQANIGVVGLAAMGSNLARNLAHHGNTVAVYNRHYSRTETLMNELLCLQKLLKNLWLLSSVRAPQSLW